MDDPASPGCLRFFLQSASKPSLQSGLPPLFATVKSDTPGRTLTGALVIGKGARVNVVEAGIFGELGVTTDLDGADAAMARVGVDELKDFGETA